MAITREKSVMLCFFIQSIIIFLYICNESLTNKVIGYIGTSPGGVRINCTEDLTKTRPGNPQHTPGTENAISENVKNRVLKQKPKKTSNLAPEERCESNLNFPAQDDRWQQVDELNHTFVFSAFVEPESNRVKIIGLSELGTGSNKRYTCWFYKKGETESKFNVKGTKTILGDHHGLRYGAVMITCNLPSKDNWYGVTVSSSLQRKRNLLILRYPQVKATRKFTLCMSVMFGPYGNAKALIESLEFNKVLGANHFVFHHHASTKQINAVLKHYINQGEMTLLNFGLPISTKEVHYYGQMASINDCVYRSRGISEYVLVADLDEMLIPYKTSNWTEMMKNLSQANPEAGAFQFRTTFFDTSMPDDTRKYSQAQLATVYNLQTFLKVWRENYIYPVNDRCKSMVKPEMVDIMYIHAIGKFKDRNKRQVYVDKDIALLHHYRLKNSSPSRIYQVYTRKYSPAVVDRVIKTYKSLKSCAPVL